MNQAELLYFIVLTLIILFSSFLPTDLLLLLDNIIIRIGIILLLLYLINIGPTAGIFGLMAVCVMYLERNRRKVAVARKKLNAMDIKRPPQATVQEEGIPQKTVPVNPFQEPKPEETSYLPEDDTCDITNFEPVAPTINQKAVLSTIYPLSSGDPESGTAATHLYEELGVGHLPDVHMMGDLSTK
jgi:hypothetical protein